MEKVLERISKKKWDKYAKSNKSICMFSSVKKRIGK